MQHAFAGGAYQQGLFSDLERQSLALTGSGDTVWDWDVARDRVVTIPDISDSSSVSPRARMHGPARNWLPRLHPDDRDRFRATLDVLLEHRRGRLNHEFRIRAEDGHYHWLSIRARPVLGANGEIIRCVGTIVDVTEQKNSVDRLLHDALHDNLTGLPNRQVFLDRLQSRAGAGARRRHAAPDRAGDRHRPLQAGQRSARHCRRRQHPDRADAPPAPAAEAAGYAGAAWRRPVRPHPDVGARSGQDRRFRRCGQQGDHGAAQFRQSRNHPDRLDRPRLLGRPAGERRRPARRRRACDVPRQEGRRQPRRALPAGLPHLRLRPAAARNRSAPRHRAQGTVDGLPADRAAGATPRSPASRR